MPRADLTSVVALTAVFAMMLVELAISRSHEKRLRAAGAIEPPGDVYRLLAWAYPAMFLAMAVEGTFSPIHQREVMFIGVCLFGAAKLLKFWAISALGFRWSFRVLILPGAPLVSTGPYAWLRHPNYLGVFGELGGMALAVDAPITGTLSLISFALLVRKRIAVEDGALRHGQPGRA